MRRSAGWAAVLPLVLGLTTACGASSAAAPAAPPASAAAAAVDPHVLGPRSVGLHWGGNSPFPAVAVGAFRLWDSGTTWRQIEPQAPRDGVHTYDWSRLDRLVGAMLEADAAPLLVLGTTPAWASTTPDQGAYYGPGSAASPRVDEWRIYVRAVAEHLRDTFGGEVREFEIWNEPNLPGFYSGTPEQMAELTSVAAKELRAVLPDAVVVSPGVAGRTGNAGPWLDAFLAAGGGDDVDVLGVHLYPPKDGTPLDGVALADRFRKTAAAHGFRGPIWDTEVNYGGKVDDRFFSDEQGAALVQQTYVVAAAAGIERTYWYAWENRVWPGIWTVEQDRATPTASGRALGHVARALAGARVEPCTQSATTVVCEVRRSGTRSATVLWSRAGAVTVQVPEGVRSARHLDGSDVPLDGSGSITVDGLPTLLERA